MIVHDAINERTGDLLNGLALAIHRENHKWWHHPKTGKPLKRNKGEMLCLIHSEISEAMEGARKALMDDHLPKRLMEEVELADALIRILDYAHGHGLDVGGAVIEKLFYNRSRADHQTKARLSKHGKKW